MLAADVVHPRLPPYPIRPIEDVEAPSLRPGWGFPMFGQDTPVFVARDGIARRRTHRRLASRAHIPIAEPEIEFAVARIMCAWTHDRIECVEHRGPFGVV